MPLRVTLLLATAVLAASLSAAAAPAVAATPPAPAATPAAAATSRLPGLAPTAPRLRAYRALLTRGNPFAGARLHVDPRSSARRAADAAPDARTAALLGKLASQPTAVWFGDWVPTGELSARVAGVVAEARAQGALPVLVAYDVPGRDCGQYSAGGAAGPAAYRAWVQAFADGLGDGPAVVVLEPDALGHLDCLTPAQRDERLALLRHAVDTLAARPAVATYLDASHWVDPAEMASRLRSAGVARARGFALNVSNYQTTPSMVAHGRSVSALVGGKPFVVDTSRSGLGPRGAEWCNAAGRALGERPLSPPPDPAVDALLWVKVVGESDGECGRGEPPAGAFYAQYATGLVERARW